MRSLLQSTLKIFSIFEKNFEKPLDKLQLLCYTIIARENKGFSQR